MGDNRTARDYQHRMMSSSLNQHEYPEYQQHQQMIRRPDKDERSFVQYVDASIDRNNREFNANRDKQKESYDFMGGYSMPGYEDTPLPNPHMRGLRRPEARDPNATTVNPVTGEEMPKHRVPQVNYRQDNANLDYKPQPKSSRNASSFNFLANQHDNSSPFTHVEASRDQVVSTQEQYEQNRAAIKANKQRITTGNVVLGEESAKDMYSRSKITGHVSHHSRRGRTVYSDYRDATEASGKENYETTRQEQFDKDVDALASARIQADQTYQPGLQEGERYMYLKNQSTGMKNVFADNNSTTAVDPRSSTRTQQGYNKRNHSEPLHDSYGPTNNWARKNDPVNAQHPYDIGQDNVNHLERSELVQRNLRSDLFAAPEQVPVSVNALIIGQQATQNYAQNRNHMTLNKNRANQSAIVFTDSISNAPPQRPAPERYYSTRHQQSSNIFGAPINYQQTRNTDKI